MKQRQCINILQIILFLFWDICLVQINDMLFISRAMDDRVQCKRNFSLYNSTKCNTLITFFTIKVCRKLFRDNRIVDDLILTYTCTWKIKSNEQCFIMYQKHIENVNWIKKKTSHLIIPKKKSQIHFCYELMNISHSWFSVLEKESVWDRLTKWSNLWISCKTDKHFES